MKTTITLIPLGNKNITNTISPELKSIRGIPLEGYLKSALIGFLLTDAGAYRTKTSTGNTRIE